jgi:hypothetical protein
MEPEGSLPYSQVPATCSYPEPTLSSPHNHSDNYVVRNKSWNWCEIKDRNVRQHIGSATVTP